MGRRVGSIRILVYFYIDGIVGSIDGSIDGRCGVEEREFCWYIVKSVVFGVRLFEF